MFYYTYCITFLSGNLTNKKYYGRRKSVKPPELDIKYKGSGVIPKSYFKIDKNRTDYKKEILATYNSLDELIVAEHRKGKTNWLKNGHLPEECKKHLSEKLTGTKLMTNGKINKYIKYDEIDKYIKDGWVLGKWQKANSYNSDK